MPTSHHTRPTVHAVRPRVRVVDRQAVRRLRAGGQQRGVHGEGAAAIMARMTRPRRGSGQARAPSCGRWAWRRARRRPRGSAIPRGGARSGRAPADGWRAWRRGADRQRHEDRPEDRGDPQGARLDGAFRLDDQIVRAVHGEGGERQQPISTVYQSRMPGVGADAGSRSTAARRSSRPRRAARRARRCRAPRRRRSRAAGWRARRRRPRTTSHSGSWTWPRSSMAMPRSISSQSTIISGR